MSLGIVVAKIRSTIKSLAQGEVTLADPACGSEG